MPPGRCSYCCSLTNALVVDTRAGLGHVDSRTGLGLRVHTECRSGKLLNQQEQL